MTVAILALLLWQVSAPGPENWAYLTCLTSSAAESLQDRPSRAEFRQRLGTLCKTEEATLRQLIIRKQLSEGRSRRQAEADAEAFFEVSRRQMLDIQPANAR